MLRPTITLVSVIILTAALFGCNGGGNGSNFLYDGTDDFLNVLYFGDVPIKANNTSNVPMNHTTKMRFELNKPVTQESLARVLDFQLEFTNLDTDSTIIVDEDVLDRNGELVWIGDSDKIIEYRMSHPMNYFTMALGAFLVNIDLGDPGDLFQVRVHYLSGENDDGQQFNFTGDEFFVLWTNEDFGVDDRDNDDLFGGSNSFLERLYIGNSIIEEGDTSNVALSTTDKIRFEVIEPVTSQSISQLLSFLIVIDNLDKDTSFTLTPDILSENGEFVWIGDDNMIVEYRLNHKMNYILSGGQQYILGAPGDELRVRILNLSVAAQDGSIIRFRDDEFFVIWSESSSGLTD